MAQSVDELFARMGKAKPSKRGTVEIKHGKYVFRVLRLLIEPNRKKQNCFKAELYIEKSEPLDDAIQPNKAGTTYTFINNLDTNENADRNVKGLVLSLLGLPDFDENDEKANAEFVQVMKIYVAAGNDRDKHPQPARGMMIASETYRTEKREKEGVFVGHNWSHVPMTADEIAASRKYLDEKDKQ